ncbi:hypothetical protein DNJ95_18415 [Stutzerimonas kirkiae]|uniref:FecR family protein n=1 Tax=Stutzerimonas kirkiae TaxID=2211392 RepID=A0A4Q9R9L0_9GAMM|nr:FecR domain-containing protein [Stutzerimonas kirkiae]TBU97357.1 hypothetical protein DNJ96_08645 [Stutzerimonas kirkiae]TBU98231.1 hypothetical protein DNJ95_18415 [Stutzerimonas kirkiae]TBV13089.1 hypothetical protein DNK01_13165 [Stutzerimonas kirkiae]
MNDEIEPVDIEAGEWVVKVQQGDLSTEEHERLRLWLARDDAHADAYARAERAWQVTALLRDDPAFAVLHERPARGWRWAAVAALLLSLLPFAYRQGDELWLSLSSDYHSAPQQVREIVLEDGSRVVLGSRSAIRLDYDDKVRRVELLRGEAMFHPAPRQGMELRPFSVVSEGLEATALGTRYLVRRGADRSVWVGVIEHRVEVGQREPARSTVQLDEGQSIGYDPRNGLRASSLDPFFEVSWTRGVLTFMDTPLDDLLVRLNQYRDKPVVLLKRELADHALSAVLRLDNLDNAPQALQGELALRVLELPGITLLY